MNKILFLIVGMLCNATVTAGDSKSNTITELTNTEALESQTKITAYMTALHSLTDSEEQHLGLLDQPKSPLTFRKRVETTLGQLMGTFPRDFPNAQILLKTQKAVIDDVRAIAAKLDADLTIEQLDKHVVRPDVFNEALRDMFQFLLTGKIDRLPERENRADEKVGTTTSRH